MDECILALDLGASKIMAGAFTGRGPIPTVVLEEPTPRRGIEDALSRAARRVVEEASCAPVAVGVASVGPIDYSIPAVVNAPNLGEDRVDLGTPLAGFEAPIIVANDAVAALAAEAILGKARGLRDAAIVVLGTGVGGAAMVDGRLVLGRRGGAHEVGHLVVSIDGPRCGCGGMGHWEALAGGRWIERASRIATGGRAVYGDAASLARALEAGDPEAARVLDFLGRVNAAGIAGLAAVYDPEVVYMAGGIVEVLGDRLIRAIEEKLPLYLLPDRRPRLERASYGRLQSLMGAYAIALDTPEELSALNTHPYAPGEGRSRRGWRARGL